jgi:16S rRNA processing protein RimM
VTTQAPADLLLVGRVFKPHGVDGTVKVIPETDDPAALADLDVLFVGASADSAQPLAVDSMRAMMSGKGLTLLVQFEGVETPEDAAVLRGRGVYAPQSLLALGEGEYFLHDLVGFDVVGEDGAAVGSVSDVYDTDAHLIYGVRLPSGKEALVPDVDAFVVDLDHGARRLTIRVIDGLLDT